MSEHVSAHPLRVEAHRAAAPAVQRGQPLDPAADLNRVRKLAELLDAKFSIAGVRFGLDGLLGLVPIAGDIATTLLALYPIYVAQQHRVGVTIRTRMLWNVGVDWVIGLVPLIGDVFDIGYKANLRNLQLLEKALQERIGTSDNPR